MFNAVPFRWRLGGWEFDIYNQKTMKLWANLKQAGRLGLSFLLIMKHFSLFNARFEIQIYDFLLAVDVGFNFVDWMSEETCFVVSANANNLCIPFMFVPVVSVWLKDTKTSRFISLLLINDTDNYAIAQGFGGLPIPPLKTKQGGNIQTNGQWRPWELSTVYFYHVFRWWDVIDGWANG